MNKNILALIYDFSNRFSAVKIFSLIEAHIQLILVSIMSCVQSVVPRCAILRPYSRVRRLYWIIIFANFRLHFLKKSFSFLPFIILEFSSLLVSHILSHPVQGEPRIYGRHFSKQDLQFLHYTAKKGLETMPEVYFNLYWITLYTNILI